MKKLVSLVLAMALLLTCLTGLVSTASAEDFSAGYDGSEVTIMFYNTMGTKLTPVLDDAIVEFNKLYPNIHVEYVAEGGYDELRDKISTEITVGSQPHIAYCYQDHVAMYNLARAVQPLDELISSQAPITLADGSTGIVGLTEEQKADFIPGYYAEGSKFEDGKMYTLPMSKSTEVLYYNKTFFEANNIAVPTTWDELEAVCQQIKAIDPTCIPLGYDSEANWFITMCEQGKSDYTSSEDPYFLFDNEANRAFVKRFNEWFTKGYFTTQNLINAYTSSLFVSTDPGRSYMSIGSSAGATHQRPTANADGSYPFEVGIATIPQLDNENRKVISQGPSLCIFKKDNVQEVIASWLFVKYLTTNVEFQAAFSMESGYVPVIQSVIENPAYAEWLEKADGGNYIAALSAKVCLSQNDAYFTSPAFVGSSEARDQVGAIMTTCLPALENIDDVIDDAFGAAIEECEYAIW